MTGPAVPFFVPQVGSSWAFQDPMGGDLGALGQGIGGVLESFAQAQQQQWQREQMQQGMMMRQMELQDTLSNNQLERDRIKLAMQLAKQQAQQQTDAIASRGSTGEAIRSGVLGAGAQGLGDAEVQDPFAGTNITPELMQAMMGMGGQDVMNIPGIEQVLGMMRAGPQVDQGMMGTTQLDAAGRPIGQYPYAPDPLRGRAGGTSSSTTQPDDFMAGQRTELLKERGRVQLIERNMPALASQAELARKVKTGALEPMWQQFSKVGLSLGFLQEGDQKVKDALEREAFLASAARQVLSELSSGQFGDARSLTEKDLEYAKQLAGGDIRLEPSTLRFVTKLLILKQRAQVKQYADFIRSNMKTPPKGYTPDTFNTRFGTVEWADSLVERLDAMADRTWNDEDNAARTAAGAMQGVKLKGK